MISAHGSTVTVTASSVIVHRTALLASLLGEDVAGEDSAAGSTVEIPLSGITGTDLHEPTSLDVGWVDLSGTGERIVFSPNQQDAARAFLADLEAAQRGENPSAGGVAGLDFVAVAVSTANGRFGSVCQVAAVRFVDGESTDEQSWLCRPPEGLDDFQETSLAAHGVTAEDVSDNPRFGEILGEVRDFVGSLPLLAYNAQFAATALRDAAAASGSAELDVLFGCSLALARHSELGVEDHRLSTLVTHLDAGEASLDDALSHARAAGAVTVKLAQRSGHRGSLMELFHSAGLTLGEIADGKVVPVLKDRSGAGRSLQARGVTSPAPQATLRGDEEKATGAGTDFRESAGEGSTAPQSETGADNGAEQGKRGPAPWQAVATPDEIPEPSAAASPDDPLNGQNVTLTGDFEPYDKGMLWSAIAEHGGQVAKNVTKKSTILVTGAWASKTSKEKRAEELNEKGQGIQIWSADQLYAALGLDEQPPF